MAKENLESLRVACLQDDELAAALSAAESHDDWIRVARENGFTIDGADIVPSADDELSDAELEGVAGGYTFAATDWIYCDNPWTNYWCTLKC